LTKKLALWDVYQATDGADDQSKRKPVNDFRTFLQKYQQIKGIIFNGQKARLAFHRAFADLYRQIPHIASWSTNGAYGKTLLDKCNAWHNAFKWLNMMIDAADREKRQATVMQANKPGTIVNNAIHQVRMERLGAHIEIINKKMERLNSIDLSQLDIFDDETDCPSLPPIERIESIPAAGSPTMRVADMNDADILLVLEQFKNNPIVKGWKEDGYSDREIVGFIRDFL
jgi:hypothetical protein